MCCVKGQYEWLRSPDEYLKNEMTLVDLDAGTTYQVRVVAKNGDGYEAGASWLAFHTPGVGEYLTDILVGKSEALGCVGLTIS